MVRQLELLNAVSNKRLDQIAALVHAGADINHQFQHETCLSCAINELSSRSVYVVELIIKLGGDINLRNQADDLTPLMQACSMTGKHAVAVSNFLLDSGADPSQVRLEDSMTALRFAVASGMNSIVERLLNMGEKPDQPNDLGFTPLMIAANSNNGAAIKLLINAGADTSLKSTLNWANGMTAFEIAMMQKCRKAVAAFKEHGVVA